MTGELVIDPDCRDGKCGSCVGGPCQHGCHAANVLPFTAPPEPEPAPKTAPPILSEEAAQLIRWAVELIWHREADSPRNRQTQVGPSQLGTTCDRELAFGARNTRPVNVSRDSWAAIVGTSVHDWLAGSLRAVDPDGRRYLVETKMTYRGVRGTCDLYDRRTRMVIDWKTTKKSKVQRIRKDGPPPKYVTQVNTYGAGLEAAGESPTWVALVFLPVDGRLDDVYAWVGEYDRQRADLAIDRLDSFEDADPAQVKASPSRLCPWCDYYRPGRPADREGCPGMTEAA